MNPESPASRFSAPARNGKRVLLVRAVEEPFNPIFFNGMSLGLLWVSAGIRAYSPGVDYRIVDWNGLCPTAQRSRFCWIDHRDSLRPERFRAVLDEYRPGIVAISAYSCFMPLACDIGRLVREYDPAVPVILGGFHSTAYPEAVAKYPMFDYFVQGEGVRVGPRLINALFDGRPALESIPSLSFRKPDGSVAETPLEVLPPNLDDNPAIDWNDVDLTPYRENRYAQIVNEWGWQYPKGKLVLYEASQGCCYRCAFCEQRVQHGNRARHFSPERVVADLRGIKERFDPEGVFFTDEYIHYDRPWFESLLVALKANRDLDLKLTLAVKADEIDRPLIDRILEAGVVQISSYPESASARIRGLMRKKIDLERHVENMRYASQQGALVFNGFVLGWPSETREEVEATYRIAAEPYSDHVHMLPVGYLGRSEIGKYLKDLSIDTDSAEYFRMLNRPTDVCLADYTRDEYNTYVVSRIHELNLAKLHSPSTRAKLARLGWEVVRLPDEAGPAPAEAAAPSAGPVELAATGAADAVSGAPAPPAAASPGEPSQGQPADPAGAGEPPAPPSPEERHRARLRRGLERTLLPYLPDLDYDVATAVVLAAPAGAAHADCIRLDLRARDTSIVVELLPRGRDAAYAHTRFFTVRYGKIRDRSDLPFAAAEERVLGRFVARLRAWEALAPRDRNKVSFLKDFVRGSSARPNR